MNLNKLFDIWKSLPERKKKGAANVFEEKLVKIYSRKNRLSLNLMVELL